MNRAPLDEHHRTNARYQPENLGQTSSPPCSSEHVVVRVLRAGRARVVGQHAQP